MPRIESSIGPNEDHIPRGREAGVLGLVAEQSLTWKLGGQILKEMAARQTPTAFYHSDVFTEIPGSWI